ncbi:DUF7344 domain-containing protein [Halorussus sp. AFM4]|uniref:DUF7344 domain-containing protein n=1 Tax=Halorussus sp. AFM4 TaxID=3421651 RepID=UPI003EB9CF91
MKESHKIHEDGGLSLLDRSLRALSNQNRRYLLYHLDEHGDAELDELSRQLVARESDCSLSSISEEDSKRIQAKLHHEHLPRLQDYGIIDYDERQGDIRLTHSSSVFTMLLEISKLVED